GSKMLGIDIEDVENVNIMQVIPDHLHELVQAELLPELMKNRTWQGELQYLNLKTGRLTDVYAVTFTITDQVTGDPLYLANVSHDISERKKAEEEKKKLEEQLFHAQKMESIGRLAGGIAHDFNNILTSIMGYAELLKMRFSETDSDEGEAADVILKGAERAADLTKQLLGFARGGKFNPVPISMNTVLKESVQVSEKIFEKNINVTFDLEENISAVEADKNQLNQIFTNLFINAKDAMPTGGVLTLKTENIYLNEEYTRQLPEFQPGNYVKISVTDTGIGMPPQVKNHIFEPFYTTKGEGKGTGLGLATVYGIIKNHNGHIEVYSESGVGTTFTIFLPVSEKEIPETSFDTEAVRGDATILVVDDEEYVRNLAKKILLNLGYTVFTAADGNEAVNLYSANKDTIGLVLLDMIMPGLAGKETFLELMKIDPKVKVILSSGFSQDGKATEILELGVLGFIQKPFRIVELSRIIHNALSE
ncbi:ATP-binding protein, partial [candidate division KSB1 bacterium]